jgi:histidinol dehydrogenase
MKIQTFPSAGAEKRLARIAKRNREFRAKDVHAVQKILNEVRKKGDSALIGYINRFDAPDLPVNSIEVTRAEMEEARDQVDKAFLRTLRKAVQQIEAFHRRQVRNSWLTTGEDGRLLGQLFRPVDAAGIYVPGGSAGRTPLVSSVLMGCIPAKIAGVKEICLCTPPTREGRVNPYLLVTAKKLGIDTIYKAGSAWGVAAMAYGTETVSPVDVIVGPGNIYVTLAKKLISGTVGIDMLAGPSEILIIADDTAEPSFVAADLLSQAEHDAYSSAILLTPSRALAEEVSSALTEQCAALTRREVAESSLKAYGALMVVPSLREAFDLANRIAPEHLELHVREPVQHLGNVRNAGAVFLGPYTPEPVGDYIAGPNHVLPTAGTARFASALSVDNFVKKTSVLYYSRYAFTKDYKDIVRMADIEGLSAHGAAMKIRKGR